MNQYIIYCTKAQTKKALELGAPIKQKIKHHIVDLGISHITGTYYVNPTAEQMIGWLEECGIENIEIGYYTTCNYWHYDVFAKEKHDILSNGYFSSRKEATLAAIDAALEYLTNNKK